MTQTLSIALILSIAAIVVALLSVPVQWELAKRFVRTRSLSIIDDAGQVRVALGVTKEGTAVMTLFDAKGTVRVSIGAHAQGASFVSAMDDKGKERLNIVQHLDGTSGITLLDSAGALRAGLLVSREDVPELSLLDAKGGLSAGLQAWNEGVRFTILDGKHKERFEVKLIGEGAPSIKAVDARGVPVFEVSQKTAGTGPSTAPPGA
jgi:hypothetical protein